MPSDCLFCRIISGELPSSQVYSDADIFAIRDIAPQAPTHVLLITQRHVASVSDLADTESDLARALLGAAAKVAEQEGVANAGYRLVINTGRNGGQTVDHLHIHLLGGRQMTWPPG